LVHFGVRGADRRRCLQNVTDSGKVRVGQVGISRAGTLLQIGDMLCTDDRDVHARLRNRPRDRQLADAHAEVGSQLLQLANDFQVSQEPFTAEDVALAAPVPGGEAPRNAGPVRTSTTQRWKYRVSLSTESKISNA
jgi:hypothetical protein